MKPPSRSEKRKRAREKPPRRIRPDQQARVQRERLRQLIRDQDETVTAIEFVSDPVQQADGRYAVEAWLYRVGTSPPERVELLLSLPVLP